MKHRGMRGPGYNMARTLAEIRERKLREWAHFRKYAFFSRMLGGPSFVDQLFPAIEINSSQGGVTCESKTLK